jgi:predicted metal-dependent phosphotriesterase family hydrolase
MTVTTFVPRLRRAGVGDATIHRMMVQNPRRLLAFVPKAT